jgi:hypothetical protein
VARLTIGCILRILFQISLSSRTMMFRGLSTSNVGKSLASAPPCIQLDFILLTGRSPHNYIPKYSRIHLELARPKTITSERSKVDGLLIKPPPCESTAQFSFPIAANTTYLALYTPNRTMPAGRLKLMGNRHVGADMPTFSLHSTPQTTSAATSTSPCSPPILSALAENCL